MIQYFIAGYLTVAIATQEILIRKLVTIYPCIYLLTLIGTVSTAFVMLVLNFLRNDAIKFVNTKLSFWIGLFSFVETILMMYCIEPNRTPLSAQTALISLLIIPGMFIVWFKSKDSSYVNLDSSDYFLGNKLRPVPLNECLFFANLLLLSFMVFLSIIFMQSHYELMSILWIEIFAISIICLASLSVMIDKYSFNDRINILSIALLFKTLFVALAFPMYFVDNIPFPTDVTVINIVMLMIYYFLYGSSQVLLLNINNNLKMTIYVAIGTIMINYYCIVSNILDDVVLLSIGVLFPIFLCTATVIGMLCYSFEL